MRLVLALVLAASALVAAHAASLSLGKRIALYGQGHVEACADCHGPQGQGRRHFAYPRLVGLDPSYLLGALRSFADGVRLNGIMTPIARDLSPQAMVAVVDYYAAFRPRVRPLARPVSRSRMTRGYRLYEHGDLQDKVVACARCHGPQAEGVGTRFPWLAGQSQAYVKEELRSFRAGGRRGLGLGLMRAAARPLSNRQISDLALYLRTIGTEPPLLPSRPKPRIARLSDHDFAPPRRSMVPITAFGKAVLRGRAIFDHTRRYAPPYVANALSCRDCHMGQGREPNAGPLWAAEALYPRVYDGRVTTLAGRIQAAFVHSERGIAPPSGSLLMTDLLAYVHWMSRGAPLGAHIAGRGYPALPRPARAPNVVTGAALYVHRCEVCHGGNGQGIRTQGRTVFPPVWGPMSFPRRSSLGRTPTLAAFLAATMPYGRPNSLRPGQAYDLAAFLEARPRPQR